MTQAEIDLMVAGVAGNGTMMGKGNGSMGADVRMEGGNGSWVPRLSVPGGLTNVTGGVDNTL